MILRIVKAVVALFFIVLLLGGLYYPFRSDPIGPLSGQKLSGDEFPHSVTDWSFSDEFTTIAVEVRPDDPHSVTTICFTHDGALYVPAQNGAEKEWTQMVEEDPRIRLKIGDAIYRGTATRVLGEAKRPKLFEAATAKYPQMAERIGDGPPPEGVWVFRVEPR